MTANMHQVDRDRLAYRVGHIANRACDVILAKEREKWNAQMDDTIRDVRREHARELADEKQKRNNSKASLRNTDFRTMREIEKSLKESSERFDTCMPKLEEITEAQYAQAARSSKAAPKRMVQKKIPEVVAPPPPPPPPPPHPEEEVHHGGKVGGKGCSKSSYDRSYIHTPPIMEPGRAIEEQPMETLHSP
jgi:hypothetical protein